MPRPTHNHDREAGPGGPGAASKGQSSDSNAENESEFGHVYGKKGHINERAFSYSIRNEQRSRSYGSLSGPNGEAGGGAIDETDNNNRKDAMMQQMMSDLELGEDHIERSEVPPGLYPPPGPYGGPHMGGPPPHMVMMPPPDHMGPMPVANGPSRKKR